MNDTAPPETEALRDLFVEVTGDEEVTEEQEGSDRRDASDEFEQIAGRSEREGLSDSIEVPDETL